VTYVVPEWHEYIIGSGHDLLMPPRPPMTFGPHLAAPFDAPALPTRTPGAANDARVGSAAHAAGDTLWQRFSVPYQFPVHFTEDVFGADNDVLLATLQRHEPVKRHRILVVVDRGVSDHLPDLMQRIAQWCAARSEHVELVEAPLLLDAGEALKRDWQALEPMRQAIHRQQIDRHSFVVAIGGGALLDAAGLVAATAHRGLRLVRLPTTVLAQNDSGVGVKNGINQFGQKNYLGTFAPPDAVINDALFLSTLGARERRAGMAEAIKVALIRDAAFFDWIEANVAALARFEARAVTTLVRRCAELHMLQIGRGGDPFESGSTRPLDFGHWAAHRLETLSAHALSHGEAVAIGIALDTRYSVSTGLLPTGADERVAALLEALGFRLWHASLDACDASGTRALLAGLDDFRIHLGGRLTITLLESIGRGVEVNTMQPTLVLESIDWLRGYA